ncbi:hypothetical protein AYP77_00510 [Lactobacillus crispatus]|uniref:hypothetical protein n=1 Tax=Lactobacillus crispatus TaxID=47770 RepID=UPI000B5D9922|nr:hypothetical protein [Lactobacillus crispatus]OXC13579.1 hypothetical protein AYP77_00510 [Lactobacillus crispatus]
MDEFKILTKEQCKKVAAEYCKNEGYELGKYEGKNLKGQEIDGYCFEAFNPDDDGLIIGYPLHIVVDDIVGEAIETRF